jgi:hypothetical protein
MKNPIYNNLRNIINKKRECFIMKLHAVLQSFYFINLIFIMFTSDRNLVAIIRDGRFSAIRKKITNRLPQVGTALNTFFTEVENNKYTPAENKTIRTRGGGNFTSFLNVYKKYQFIFTTANERISLYENEMNVLTAGHLHERH